MEQEPQNETLTESTLEYYFDQEKEINVFYFNIKRGYRKFLDSIYIHFPELTNLDKNPDNLSEDEIRSKIKGVILDFRQKHAENITKAENIIKTELPEINAGIEELENFMGETEHFKYSVMPSVYPVCPFDKKLNLFYYTITNAAKGKTDTSIPSHLSSIALHEISHFIFFRQIDQIPNKLSDRGIHHLKEVLTPVLLNHPDILKHRQDKYICGNEESIKYQVSLGGQIMSIFDYVNTEFLKNPTPEGYTTFLHWLINLFEKIEPEVLKRDKLHMNNGRLVFTDPALNAEFMEPIQINGNY